MTTYSISNRTSGQDLGQYQGATALDAYRAMMADAGYATNEQATACGWSLEEIPDDIDVTEVSQPIRVTGHDAIEYARRTGTLLSCYQAEEQDESDSLTVDQAEDIAADDPSLIYVAPTGHPCDCGRAVGSSCGTTISDPVILAYVPAYQRGTCEAAGCWGGAEELCVCDRACAEAIVETEPEWAEIQGED